MLKIDIWPEAQVFLQALTAKHGKQVVSKIATLAENPNPPLSKLLTGYTHLRRLRSGDYRIIYFVDGNVLKVPLIDKRNDNKIYKMIEQKFRQM